MCVCMRDRGIHIHSHKHIHESSKEEINTTTKHGKQTFLNWGEGSAQQLTSFVLLVSIVIGYHETHVVTVMREGLNWMQIQKAVLREAPKPVLHLCWCVHASPWLLLKSTLIVTKSGTESKTLCKAMLVMMVNRLHSESKGCITGVWENICSLGVRLGAAKSNGDEPHGITSLMRYCYFPQNSPLAKWYIPNCAPASTKRNSPYVCLGFPCPLHCLHFSSCSSQHGVPSTLPHSKQGITSLGKGSVSLSSL